MDIAITAVLVIIVVYYLFNYSGKKKAQSGASKAKNKSDHNMKYGKWVGGGLGWAFGGPIGAILGFAFGSMYDGMQSGKYAVNQGTTKRGDFSVSLLILSAALMKADGRITKSELEYVKAFLIRQFGPQAGQEQLGMLKEILKQEYSIGDVSKQIGQYMDYSSRLQLLHYLFGLSGADGHTHPKELDLIQTISAYLGIKTPDFNMEFQEAISFVDVGVCIAYAMVFILLSYLVLKRRDI
jgi:uncharacterized tellurite resistance protein B-like protein